VVNIYGDGKQVRDVLWVEDLLDAYEAVLKRPDLATGEIFNIGGGPEFTIAVWTETKPLLESLAGRSLPAVHHPWRPGDQRIYVSDIRKAKEILGWQPIVKPSDGIERLWNWVAAHRELFQANHGSLTPTHTFA
jgi:CDP-paratose 2-epimerase